MQIVVSPVIPSHELHAQLLAIDLTTDFTDGIDCMACRKCFKSASGMKKHLLNYHKADPRAIAESDLHVLVRQADYAARDKKRIAKRLEGKAMGEGEAENLLKYADGQGTHVYCRACKCSLQKNSIVRHFTTKKHNLAPEVITSMFCTIYLL